MNERPIIFNSEMVRAVMEGRKVQTRRIIKDCPTVQDGWYPDRYNNSEEWTFWGPRGSADAGRCTLPFVKCPFGAVGDRLWVRETARCEWQRCDFKKHVCETGVVYSADGVSRTFLSQEQHKFFPRCGRTTSGELAWHPSIHMPRWASRITLEITGIRVERLTALSDDDARNEGCPAQLPHNPEDGHQARTWFRGLWSEIYGEESWQANPWVWVIEFKRVEGE